MYGGLSADAERLKLPGAGSVTGVGLTINRVTQAAAFTYIQQGLLTTRIYFHLYLCCRRFSLLFDVLTDTCSLNVVKLLKCKVS